MIQKREFSPCVEWQNSRWSAILARGAGKHLIFHGDKEPKIEMSFKEVCQLAELLERVIRDA